MAITGKKQRLLIDAAVIAAINIILRSAAVGFNSYLSAKMGAEAMGLFTLTMSIYGFAVTLASSGVNLAAVRLTAERYAVLDSLGAGKQQGRRCMGRVVSCCLIYCALFSIPTSVGLYLLSPVIGEKLLCDARSVTSLRALALSLPAIAFSSALSGYFTGLRKTVKNAVSAVSEQAVKIVLTAAALTLSLPHSMDRIEYACLAVVGSSAFAEAMSLLLNAVLYFFDSRSPAGRSFKKSASIVKTPKTSLKDTALIAMPVAVGAYVRQALTAAEHIAIPRGLKKSGHEQTAALESYGILHGMVFPLILFPSAVVSSAAGLLVPELAELCAKGKKLQIYSTVRSVFQLTLNFSLCCAAVFFFFGDMLGVKLYGSGEAGARIVALAALVPVMYFDMAVDCMLKGLGQQVHSMRINIIDSSCSLCLVLLLIPRFGIAGYIASVFFCEVLNCVLSVRHLKRITGVGPGVRDIVIPLASAALSGAASKLLFEKTGSEHIFFAVVLCVLLFCLTCCLPMLLRERAKKECGQYAGGILKNKRKRGII